VKKFSRLCYILNLLHIFHYSVVGYQTVENVSVTKFYPLAVQFESTSATDLAVKDLLVVSAPAGGLTLGAGADQIWRWDTEKSDWKKYFWRSGRGVTTPCWCNEGDTTETVDTIPAGENVFFYRGGTAVTSLTLAGGVKSFEATKAYSASVTKFVFMGYPWPQELEVSVFSNFYSSGSPAGGLTLGAGADQIWRWDTVNANWVKYFYRSGRGVTNAGWCKEGETDIITDKIPVGEGFFFYRGGSTTVNIEFTK
jgi:hypothetical protein